jgi:hypothetical protein
MTFTNHNIAHTYERAVALVENMQFPIVMEVAFWQRAYSAPLRTKTQLTKEAFELMKSISPTGEVRLIEVSENVYESKSFHACQRDDPRPY